MLKKVVTKFREKVILKTPKNTTKTIYKRWERGRTAIFLEVPLRGDLRFTLSKLSVWLNVQISETLVIKLENMIYLHLVHHHHFQTSPGIFWFQAQDVQPQWVPQWTRDMQKPGAIPLFSFFLQKLDEILLFCLWQKIWCGDSIVFNFILQKPGPILLFFLVEKNLVEFYCCCFLGVAKHAVIERI